MGSLPPPDHPDLLDIPTSRYRPVDEFTGLQALEVDRVDALGQTHRGVLTHSHELHHGQSRGLDQTLAKAGRRLAGIAGVLARGRRRRDRDQLQTAVETITNKRWVTDLVTTTITGESPATFRLDWRVDADPRARLEDHIFGKRILITDRRDWTVAEIIAGYRSQSDAEFGFRQQ